MKTRYLVYNGLSDLIEHVHLKPHETNKNLRIVEHFQKDLRKGGISWYGEDWTPSQVVKAVQSGYKPGIQRIQNALKKISIDPMESVKRKMSNGDSGDFLDMQKVYSGDLSTAWRKCKRSPGVNRGNKSVTITVNIGANCGTSADNLAWCGAYGAGLADAYAQAGYNVEVWGYCHARNLSPGQYHAEVCIKLLDSNEPFDLEKLGSTLVFPGFFRVLAFEALLTVPNTNDSLGQSSVNASEYLQNENPIIITGIRSLEDIQDAEQKRRAGE